LHTCVVPQLVVAAYGKESTPHSSPSSRLGLLCSDAPQVYSSFVLFSVIHEPVTVHGHSRENGNPAFLTSYWIPAPRLKHAGTGFAGMTIFDVETEFFSVLIKTNSKANWKFTLYPFAKANWKFTLYPFAGEGRACP